MSRGGRGFDAFTRGTVLASDPAVPPVVGHAVTARIAARHPPVDAPETVRTRRTAHCRRIAEARKRPMSFMALERCSQAFERARP